MYWLKLRLCATRRKYSVPWARSKWKLWLSKTTSSVDQQAKLWLNKTTSSVDQQAKLWLNKTTSSVDQQTKQWTLSHTRCPIYMSHARTRSKLPPPPHPSWNGQVPKYECWLQNTGLFHFCLDKAGVLNCFSPSTFTLDLTASVWHNKAYSHLTASVWHNKAYSHLTASVWHNKAYSHLLLFFLPTPSKLSVLSSTSNEETIEMAKKNITTTSY